MFELMIIFAFVMLLFAFGWVLGCVAALDTIRAEAPDLYEEWKRRHDERRGRQ